MEVHVSCKFIKLNLRPRREFANSKVCKENTGFRIYEGGKVLKLMS